MANLLRRVDVPLDQTWDLESLYSSVSAWETDLTRLEGLVDSYANLRADMGTDAASLLALLRLRDEICQTLDQVACYADNRVVEDQSDAARQGMQQRAGKARTLVGTALSRFEADVLALPANTMETWMLANPELARYRAFLDQIRSKQGHQLSLDAEKVIGSISELAQSPFIVWQNTINADLVLDPVRDESGQLVPMSFGALSRLYVSPDRNVRRAAFDSINAGLASHKYTLAALLSTAVKRDVMLAQIRRYPSSLAAALAPVGLPETVLRSLVCTAEAGSVHLRRYMVLRAKMLGLQQLASYDMTVPLDQNLPRSWTFAEGFETVVEALAPLGAQYGDLLRTARRDRWIDWANNIGKSVVPFSRGCYGFHPVVNLPWNGTLSDVIVLAHELGHAMHSALSQAAQPYVYSGYGGMLAETASTVNELLLTQHLRNVSTDRQLRRYLLAKTIDSFITNFFYASLATSLQLELHDMSERGIPLTYESITEVNTRLYHNYYGDTLEIAPQGIGSQWLRAPQHYFGFFFYNYVIGITAAAALSEGILSEPETAPGRYRAFLEAGCSAPPLDVLRLAGVDLESPRAAERAVDVFSTLVTALENA